MHWVVSLVAAASLLSACSRAPEGRARKTLKLTGTVVEQVDGPPYSYLRLETDAGEVWAMVPTASVATNERVTVYDGVLLKDFDTGLPGRRFDVVMGMLERRW
jgi:starvation-inducible outer membrane lipoprotein